MTPLTFTYRSLYFCDTYLIYISLRYRLQYIKSKNPAYLVSSLFKDCVKDFRPRNGYKQESSYKQDNIFQTIQHLLPDKYFIIGNDNAAKKIEAHDHSITNSYFIQYSVFIHSLSINSFTMLFAHSNNIDRK